MTDQDASEPVPAAKGLEVKRLLRDHESDPSWAEELAALRAGLSVAELLVGVELADAVHRPRRQSLVESILATVPVEDYDLDVARSHARLLAHARRSGRRRGAHDLVITATALARDRIVVTADRNGFSGLPGVGVRLVAGSAVEG